MSKFKVGEKVIVTKPDKFFNKNDVGIVLKYCRNSTPELEVIEGKYPGRSLLIEENQVEKFLEPKFKVGDVIYCWKSINTEDKGEIVKVALNKKRGTFSYLAFSYESGFPIALMENEVKLVEQKSKVEEMTVAQICKALGKEIKIIK